MSPRTAKSVITCNRQTAVQNFLDPFQLTPLHHCSERHRDLPSQCHHAQIIVSPRTVDSVTTHSQECHHAQQAEQTLQSFRTRVTSSSHSSHSTFISTRHEELSERPVNQRIRSVISVITKGETPPILILLPPVTHLLSDRSVKHKDRERYSNIQKREEERRETAEGQFPR